MGEESEKGRMVDGQTVEISLPNEQGYERIAMETTASFAKIVGFAPERVEDLKTAVSEACRNAIEHGNGGRLDARVYVTMNFKDGSFRVSVRDEGKGIREFPEPPDITEKIKTQEAPGGIGTFLIKELMDQVEFNHLPGEGHEVKMILKLAH